ncbi:uncharacterized protein Z519_07584 [Cladophialophora bantiana CBS 173.52]|uniref:Uncharacterized protein n=1 Tax=Cladophialophora bantiana (strain ATCC 10958 / CBS 173.52 / CDC B-1940 / NIH 8579) TaxID=1442370 RepID=A0A0D2ENQ4_CLAB1|nr:uncharacterized protein Z519_07584 [Cladophialophora bantiana CBS 173.52]KIW91616.1 hypothetical protein Z519_07584 [Cladophialophora bantiana CBS 173.52]
MRRPDYVFPPLPFRPTNIMIGWYDHYLPRDRLIEPTRHDQCDDFKFLSCNSARNVRYDGNYFPNGWTVGLAQPEDSELLNLDANILPISTAAFKTQNLLCDSTFEQLQWTGQENSSPDSGFAKTPFSGTAYFPNSVGYLPNLEEDPFGAFNFHCAFGKYDDTANSEPSTSSTGSQQLSSPPPDLDALPGTAPVSYNTWDTFLGQNEDPWVKFTNEEREETLRELSQEMHMDMSQQSSSLMSTIAQDQEQQLPSINR